MAKEKKELTTKQQIRRLKGWQIACKVGEYAVIPIPFVALMIANRSTWFATPASGWAIGIGGTATIGLLIASLIMVFLETEDKKVTSGYPLVIAKWLMAVIIITIVENFLHTIAGVMWIATSGLAASFGLDITRKQLKKKEIKKQGDLDGAERQRGIAKASEELAMEDKPNKIKIKIKK